MKRANGLAILLVVGVELLRLSERHLWEEFESAVDLR